MTDAKQIPPATTKHHATETPTEAPQTPCTPVDNTPQAPRTNIEHSQDFSSISPQLNTATRSPIATDFNVQLLPLETYQTSILFDHLSFKSMTTDSSQIRLTRYLAREGWDSLVEFENHAIKNNYRSQEVTSKPRSSAFSQIPIDIVSKVHKLYFDERLTQRKIAQKLGISEWTVRRIFKEQGWNARRFSRKSNIDHEEVRRLYFDKGLSQLEVAKQLGFKTENPIRRIFREQGWKPRKDRTGITMRIFKDDKERQLARKESRLSITKTIHELRKNLLGTECKICKIHKEKRTFVGHRKDGTEHDKELLWRIQYLKSQTPKDWVGLCVACHRGVHWLMKRFEMDWNTIETFLDMKSHSNPETKKALDLSDGEIAVSKEFRKIENQFEGDLKELRRALFGYTCQICGVHYEEKRLVTHRKDGRPHSGKILALKKYLIKLNPKNWASLCQKCHRYVHWAMDLLYLKWDDFESDSIE